MANQPFKFGQTYTVPPSKRAEFERLKAEYIAANYSKADAERLAAKAICTGKLKNISQKP